MLEEKLEELTKAVVALRQVLEKGGTTGAAKPAAKAGAKAKASDDDEDEPKAKPKAKKVETEHDEDEVGSKFRKAAKVDKPRCQKYLAKVECEDLAELLTKPELFDAAYEFAEKVIATDDDD